MLLSTIACNQIWSMAFLMTCTDLMLHISMRKAILLVQGNQEEILGVFQQLTNQSWTVLTTTIAFIIAIAINVKYPVIILLSILPIVANVICTRQRSLLLRWRPKVSQARRTRRRSLLLRYAALITSTGRHQVLVLFLCRHRSTHWMAGHDVYYKRTKRERSGCDNRQEQRSCSLFLS